MNGYKKENGRSTYRSSEYARLISTRHIFEFSKHLMNVSSLPLQLYINIKYPQNNIACHHMLKIRVAKKVC